MIEKTEITLIQRASTFKEKKAIITSEGSFTYSQLLQASEKVASSLLCQAKDLQETRVAFVMPSGFHYVAVQWGIWRAGGIAVPLSVFHPKPEMEYVIEDSDAEIVVSHPDFESKLRPVAQTTGKRFLLTSDVLETEAMTLPPINPNRRAMILYTSGTTSKPKGVVTTHKNIETQIVSLIEAWEWSPEDHILHVLPLHHIHGIINVLTCTLWAGATCEMLPKFDAEMVWERIVKGSLTLFMAVPTIFTKLISFWENSPPERQREMSDASSRLRLMVSGSAALPVSVLDKWKEITGHTLLERYGMTEVGMILSNPLHGQRIPGYVGTPLPYIQVSLVDEKGKKVESDASGEILVKGPSVFLEYWRKPNVTQRAFQEGWFRTGDIAAVEDGNYRLLGRSSVDIINTGGYKVSALEIEEVLRTHPEIKECAVVGIDDIEWGERVGVALILNQDSDLNLNALRKWTRERLAVYKIPTRMHIVEKLPRNLMGKVFKPDVTKLFKA